jgi:hypothetical protein
MKKAEVELGAIALGAAPIRGIDPPAREVARAAVNSPTAAAEP